MNKKPFREVLVRARKSAGLTQSVVGAWAGHGKSAVSKWESGVCRPLRADVEILDRRLGCHGALVRAWQVEETGSLLSPWEQSIPAMERKSLRIELGSPWVIPGILQCPAYAELMMAEGIHLGSREQITAEARRKATRYDALRRDTDPWITAVFPRLAIANLPTRVRTEQVVRLLSIIEGGRVRVHLTPNDAIVGLVSPLMLFHLRDGGVVAASEHNRGVVLHDDPTDHERMATQFQRSLGSAISAEESLRDIERMVR